MWSQARSSAQYLHLPDRIQKNIRKVKSTCLARNIHFRPHFKTHQSFTVADIFAEEGVRSITVSSLFMAQKFAERGFKDIFIAIPYCPSECDNLLHWLKSCPDLKLILLLDDYCAAEKIVHSLRDAVWYSLKVDTGYHRAGIPYDDFPAFFAMIELLRRYNVLDKLYSLTAHFGHVYNAKNKEEVLSINTVGIQGLKGLKNKIVSRFATHPIISIGDTPSLSIYNPDLLDGVGEIRPGNFVFFDAMQWVANYCSLDDIAVLVNAPILALYPHRNEILIHAGAVHLSKEFCMFNEQKCFGLPVKIIDNKQLEIFPQANVVQLSQEHGIVRFNLGIPTDLICGGSLTIIPVHSCLMMACMNPDYL